MKSTRHRHMAGRNAWWLLALLLAGSVRAEIPLATAIAPDNAAVGYSAFTAKVYGVDFQDGITQARLGGNSVPVQYLDATSLQFVVSAGLTAGPRDLELSNDGEVWSLLDNALMIYSQVTLNGTYSGSYDYSNSLVTVNNVTISSYANTTNTGWLEVRAWKVLVSGTVDAKGRGYGGGGGGGGWWGYDASRGSGGQSGGATLDGTTVSSSTRSGGIGGGSGGGGGGAGGGLSSTSVGGGGGTGGGGSGGATISSYPAKGGGGGGGSGGSCTAGNGGNGSSSTGGSAGSGCGGGGNGGTANFSSNSGGGGGGGGGPYGGGGGRAGYNAYTNGANGSRGGYRSSGANGDTTTNDVVSMGSGGGGGGGGFGSGLGGYGGVAPTSLSAYADPGSGGAAGGGMVRLVASDELRVNGTIEASGAGRANLGGGYGAGGGILLQGRNISISGTVRTLGGFSDGAGTTVNGGTVKIIAMNSLSGTVSSANAGRIYSPGIPIVTISGRVTNRASGAGISGVSLVGAGANINAVTAGDGSYNLNVPYNWSGSVVPSYGISGTFSPASRAYSVISNNIAAQDYGWAQAFMLPPGILAATNIFRTAFNANWSGVGGATNYLLDVSYDHTFATFVSGYEGRAVGNVETWRVTGLTGGATCYFRVRAQSTVFISDYSATNSVTLSSLLSPQLGLGTCSAVDFFVDWDEVAGANNYLWDVATDADFTSFVGDYHDKPTGGGQYPFIYAFPSGLSPATPYFLRVRAVAGGFSSDYATLQVTTAPLAPVATAATNATRTGFCANWNAAAGAVSYQLDVSRTINFVTTPANWYVPGYEHRNVGNTLTECLSGLAPGETYYYRVLAVGPDGASGNSETISVTTTPDPPAVLAATNITGRTFWANWDRLSIALNFLLDVSTSPTFASFVPGYEGRSVGDVGTAQVTGLDLCTTYYYRLRMQNEGGTSANSGVITVTTAPEAPASAAASGTTETSFQANWGAVGDATGYRLDVSASSSFSSYLAGYQNLSVGNVTTWPVAGLAAGNTYYFRARAEFSCGGAGPSASTRSVTTIPVAPAPTVSSVQSASFRLSWSDVLGASEYRVDVATDDEFTSYVPGYQDRANGGASITVSGLSPNGAYYARVRAANASGASVNSGTLTATLAPDAPEALAATDVVGTSFAANWAAAAGATGYRLDVSLNSSFSSYASGYEDLAVGDVVTRSVTGLQAGYTYYYRLRSLGGDGASTNSATMEATTFPNPPTAQAAGALTETGFTANWVWQGIATNYLLEVATDSGFAVHVAGFENYSAGTTASVAVPGLSPNGTYYYRVRLQNKGGTSGYSETIEVNTAPAAPTALPATLVTPVSFRANWSASAGATTYLLDVATDAGFTACVPGLLNAEVGDAQQRVVTGLAPGRTYHYRVRAQNGQGVASGNSGTITVTTDPVEVSISNLVVDVASGVGTVMWASVATVAYDVYQSDSPYGTGMTWTCARAVTAVAACASAPVNTAPARFYQLAVASDAPAGGGVWGVIKPEARPGFTLMSPPLRTDRRFDGKMGVELAESLTGHNGGVGDGQGDEVHVLQADGNWRTLYLDAQKVWRESSGAASSYELPVGCGFFVLRNEMASSRITFTGPVGNDGSRTNRVGTGWNILGLSEGAILPVKTTFSNAVPRGGSSEAQADQVVLQNPDGTWRRLMYVSGWGAPYDGNWFDLKSFQIVTNKLEPGAAYYYFRQPAAGSTDVKF